MLQSHPPPPNLKTRLITAAIVLSIGGYFVVTAATMGANGYDENTAALRLETLRGLITNVEIPAGTYDLSWVTIYNGEPSTTGWNVNIRILAPGGTAAFNKTFAWSETLNCFSCSNSYGAYRTALERVNLTGGNYSVQVRVAYANTTGAFIPVRAVLSFLSPERELFFGSYLWIGLGVFLAQLGILGLWRRRDRKNFQKWFEWKRMAEGEVSEAPPKGRKARREARRKGK